MNRQYQSVHPSSNRKQNQQTNYNTWINVNNIMKLVFAIFTVFIIKYLSDASLEVQKLSDIKEKIKLQFIQVKQKDIESWQQLIELSSIVLPQSTFDLLQAKLRAKQGIERDIQIGSYYDYLQINNTEQFGLFKNNFVKLAPHQVFSFDYNTKLQLNRSYIESSTFRNDKQINDYLYSSVEYELPWYYQNAQTRLAINLNWRFNQSRNRQAEYYLTNKKYNYSHLEQQLPICLISTGYKVYTKDKYKRFFQSIERQNYSNYNVVVMDDCSPDNSALHFYQHLKNTTYKLKNRVKIVKTLQRMGALANMYIGVKKYCPSNSIVVNVDSDDALIGAQTFNILNAIYQDPNVWYVYTRYLWQRNQSQVPDMIISRQLYFAVHKYRQTIDWVSSHLRTYRQKLMDNVPVQHFIQYKYNGSTNKIYPYFHQSSADRFQAYSHLQMCGNERVRYITDLLYFYERGQSSNQGCYRQLEMFQQFKSRIKKPLAKLESLDSPTQYSNEPIPISLQNGLTDYYSDIEKCKRIKQSH